MCKPIHDIIHYSTSICPFESGKAVKEGKESQIFEYLENKKSFLNEINVFHSFQRAIIWWENKNLIKIADTSFNLKILENVGNIIDLSTFIIFLYLSMYEKIFFDIVLAGNGINYKFSFFKRTILLKEHDIFMEDNMLWNLISCIIVCHMF